MWYVADRIDGTSDWVRASMTAYHCSSGLLQSGLAVNAVQDVYGDRWKMAN